MRSHANLDYLQCLVTELRKLPAETGWVEFKENNSNPEEIGEYLSALSNSAALNGKARAYLVWGIGELEFVKNMAATMGMTGYGPCSPKMCWPG